MSSAFKSARYSSSKLNWRLRARYVKRPRRCRRAIAWSRSSSKVIADPPPASAALRIQVRECGYLLDPFVPQRAGKGKQEVWVHVCLRQLYDTVTVPL